MILVTGASGFIGRHLQALLVKKFGSDKVLALTSKPVAGCKFLLHDKYSFERDFFAKNGVESITTVVHAGSFTPKAGIHANNWAESNQNIISTDRLLNAILPNLKLFVFLSTADVYAADDVISESSTLEPISLYAHSKRYIELMTEAWAKANNISLRILRVGHVYGPGEELYQKVIPLTFSKIIRKEGIQIIGTGMELRSFIFIDDVVEAIANGLSFSGAMEITNIVGSQPITIKELVNKMIEVSARNCSVEYVHTQGKGRDLVFDASKMKNLLGRPETPLDLGLRAEWQYMSAKST